MVFRIGLIALPVPEICAEMTSKTALNANISITAYHIDAQFVAVSTELNSAHFVWDTFFESTSGMREWRPWNIQSLISPLL